MQEGQAREFIEALRRLEEKDDLEGMVGVHAEDAELRNPTDGEPHQGREGARRFWDAYRRSFAEIRSEFRNVVEAEGVAMLEWTSRGRTADDVPVEYEGVSVVEFRDGKVSRFRTYFDPRDLGEQIARTGE